MPARSHFPRPAGFTLLEVIISLTLLTVVLGAVYASFHSVSRLYERFDSAPRKYHDARAALDIMRREIESSLLEKEDDRPEQKDARVARTLFIMKDRDILGKHASELSLTSYSLRSGIVNTISYFPEENEGKLDLIKRETLPGSSDVIYSSGVIENIESFSVETLFNDEWVSTWDTSSTGKLPDVLRVIITFDDNGTIVRMVEYARPRIGRQL